MIRLDDETEARLNRLAERTGRSKSFYVREATLEKLEEYEDYYLAKDSLEEFRQSDDALIDLADVEWPAE
ncbi:MAG: TraY domain-containing protein [Salinibacterium sp.]|jgi:RHH-type rel operon transcriptional repressor/antitoxin RelB|nr:TraY domain-containing protein [Cryobacterium sp.]MCB1280006.1 TraY domain-containing protein [Salinibacterium sp.]